MCSQCLVQQINVLLVDVVASVLIYMVQLHHLAARYCCSYQLMHSIHYMYSCTHCTHYSYCISLTHIACSSQCVWCVWDLQLQVLTASHQQLDQQHVVVICVSQYCIMQLVCGVQTLCILHGYSGVLHDVVVWCTSYVEYLHYITQRGKQQIHRECVLLLVCVSLCQ